MGHKDTRQPAKVIIKAPSITVQQRHPPNHSLSVDQPPPQQPIRSTAPPQRPPTPRASHFWLRSHGKIPPKLHTPSPRSLLCHFTSPLPAPRLPSRSAQTPLTLPRASLPAAKAKHRLITKIFPWQTRLSQSLCDPMRLPIIRARPPCIVSSPRLTYRYMSHFLP
jgi:hypothetical protein